MFAGTGALVGGFDPTIQGDYSFLGLSVPTPAFIIFQTVFCATAATIVSGAMAERTKFISYCIYSAVISAVIYPISGHWIWGGGWLAQLAFMISPVPQPFTWSAVSRHWLVLKSSVPVW